MAAADVATAELVAVAANEATAALVATAVETAGPPSVAETRVWGLTRLVLSALFVASRQGLESPAGVALFALLCSREGPRSEPKVSRQGLESPAGWLEPKVSGHGPESPTGVTLVVMPCSQEVLASLPAQTARLMARSAAHLLAYLTGYHSDVAGSGNKTTALATALIPGSMARKLGDSESSGGRTLVTRPGAAVASRVLEALPQTAGWCQRRRHGSRPRENSDDKGSLSWA